MLADIFSALPSSPLAKICRFTSLSIACNSDAPVLNVTFFQVIPASVEYVKILFLPTEIFGGV